MIKYAPITKNGKFTVSNGEYTMTCRAGDKAQAIHKFMVKFEVPRTRHNFHTITCNAIEKTERRYEVR